MSLPLQPRPPASAVPIDTIDDATLMRCIEAVRALGDGPAVAALEALRPRCPDCGRLAMDERTFAAFTDPAETFGRCLKAAGLYQGAYLADCRAAAVQRTAYARGWRAAAQICASEAMAQADACLETNELDTLESNERRRLGHLYKDAAQHYCDIAQNTPPDPEAPR